MLEKKQTSWPSVFERNWMDRFFDTPLDEFFNFGKVMNVPAVNVHENDKEFRMSIAAPGLEKKDFKVEMTEDMLTISAEKEKEEKEEKGKTFHRVERRSSEVPIRSGAPEQGQEGVRRPFVQGHRGDDHLEVRTDAVDEVHRGAREVVLQELMPPVGLHRSRLLRESEK